MDMPETMAALLERAEGDCRAVFAAIDEQEIRWTNRVLHTFQEHRVASRHFAGSTGYGYADGIRSKASWHRCFAPRRRLCGRS
jgi:cystathionine beta-lyase family protein involved in aluminum resistance